MMISRKHVEPRLGSDSGLLLLRVSGTEAPIIIIIIIIGVIVVVDIVIIIIIIIIIINQLFINTYINRNRRRYIYDASYSAQNLHAKTLYAYLRNYIQRKSRRRKRCAEVMCPGRTSGLTGIKDFNAFRLQVSHGT